MILIASVLTGLAGLSYQGMQAEHILARYVVLSFSFIGGASIGCTVGVVTGLILGLANIGNLYQMSLLAFSGLLGGLLKEGKKRVQQSVLSLVHFLYLYMVKALPV